MRARLKITPRGIFLSPRRVSPFLARGDFQARSRFARSTIPEEKWGTTRSLPGPVLGASGPLTKKMCKT